MEFETLIGIVAALAFLKVLVWFFTPAPTIRPSSRLRLDLGYSTNDLMRHIAELAPIVDRKRSTKKAAAAATPFSALTVNVNTGTALPGLGNLSPSTPIFFKPGEPQWLEEFGVQEGVVDKLQMLLDNIQPGELLPPQIFLGVAGTGKTLLAKILANELRKRWARGPFLEVLGNLDDPGQLDEYLRVAQQYPGTTLFFDEVHELPRPIYTKLFELMENGRYKFKGEAHPVPLKVQLLAATTEFGRMDPAFRRRWVKNYFQPATPEQIRSIVSRRNFPIDDAALDLLVSRTHFAGAPWEAVELYNLAKASAGSRNSPIIEVIDVERVFDQEDVDNYGLRRLDRAVLAALLTQRATRTVKGVTEVSYKASEQTVCALAGIDRAEYLEVVRPRLQSRGLLVVRGGQSLTDKAVELYGHLRAA